MEWERAASYERFNLSIDESEGEEETKLEWSSGRGRFMINNTVGYGAVPLEKPAAPARCRPFVVVLVVAALSAGLAGAGFRRHQHRRDVATLTPVRVAEAPALAETSADGPVAPAPVPPVPPEDPPAPVPPVPPELPPAPTAAPTLEPTHRPTHSIDWHWTHDGAGQTVAWLSVLLLLVGALVGLHCFSGILFFASDARDLDDEKVPLMGGRRIAPADGYRYEGGPTYDDDDDPAVVYEDLGGGSDEEELPIPTARAFVL